MGCVCVCVLLSLQVSRCEKFGYGVMVTQVAATAPGVVALHCSGTDALTHTNKQTNKQAVATCDA